MKVTEELYVPNREDWRTWLVKNHDSKTEVWLVFFKKHTGKPTIPYNDAVEEALCFGWIDSIVQKVDDEKFVRKFTPRKSRSRWSKTNRSRVQRMTLGGKMTKAGLAKVEDAKNTGEWLKSARPRRGLTVPADLERALASNRKASDYFNGLAKTYKMHFIGWITSAKKEETRKRRLAEAVRLLEQNKKLGLK